MANSNSISIRNSKKYTTPTGANLAHNAGLKVASYWLDKNPKLEQNFQPKSYSEVNEVWNNWIAEAKERYLRKHNRGIRSEAVIIEEGLISVGKDVQGREDLSKLNSMVLKFVEKFEKDNNTQVLHWSIHNHEGKNEDTKNIHAHFFFDNIAKDGEMVRRRWKKSYMAQLQTDVFEASKNIFDDIERAIDYEKIGQKAPKHQHHRVFRLQQERAEAKIELATQKDLKEEIAKLREELKTNHAERRDYAVVEQLNRELQMQVKDKSLTIESLYKQINAQKQHITALESKNESLHEEIVKKDEIITSMPNVNDVITQVNEEAKDILLGKEVEIKGILSIVKFLKEKYFQLKDIIKNLKAENEALRTENLTLKQQTNKLGTKELLATLRDKHQEFTDSANRLYLNERDEILDSMEENSEYIATKAYRFKL